MRGRNKQVKALKLMFNNSVTCKKCGRELKGKSVARLGALGCDHCGCKEFEFHGLSEEVVSELERMGVQFNV
jgi:predicted  nucleic acid-binding Zn-ribbon protein